MNDIKIHVIKDDIDNDIFKISFGSIDDFSKDITLLKEPLKFIIDRITNLDCKVKICKVKDEIRCEIIKPKNKNE